MKAAVLTEPRKLMVKDLPKPEPGPREALIRVSLGGICGSDHTLYQGRAGVPLPIVPGHEAIGRIESVGGQVSGLSIGQRVTIQPNVACHTCRVCRAGFPNICPSKIRIGLDVNGVFAQYVTAPAEYVWPVPDEMADEVAVFTEPLTVAVHAVKICAPRENERTLIFGAGVIGALTLQLAALHKAQVAACDLSETRLALAKQMGASLVFKGDEADQPSPGEFDLIYETSGAPSGLAQAIRLAAPRGKIVVLGLPGKEHTIPVDLIVRKELKIMGSMIYSDEFPESIALLNEGKIRTGPLNTGKLSLDKLDQGLREFSSPERMKVLVEIP